MLPFPVRFPGESIAAPTKAPEVGEQNADVLGEVLGYDEARIAELKDKGVFG
jgi:crotonobetainyl-CoA:carnitine CoA-transferase CaiB-like acyl-CoA transferase